jgi:hypothetical protein
MRFRTFTFLVVFIAAGAATGCLSSTTIVKLRPDGSGTIEQSVLVNPEMAKSLAALASQMGGEKSPPPTLPSPRELMDESRLKEAASRFGRGVRFVSSAPLKEGELEGSRAVFAFDDINALTVDQSPDAASHPRRDQVGFTLSRQPNGTSVLTINFPQDEHRAPTGAAATPAEPRQQVPPEALALIRPFLEGMRVAIALDVDGTLVKTNAEHVTGKRITLLDVNFSELLKDPAALQKLSSVGPGAGIGDLKPVLQGVPGIKVNTSPTLSVEFR